MGKITKAVGKQKSRRSKTKSKQASNPTCLAATPTASSENWVDRLEFESTKSSSTFQDDDEEESSNTNTSSRPSSVQHDDDDDDDDDESTRLRIISFNILAQAYLSPRSHRGLPSQYRNIVFDPSKRQQVLARVLRRLASLQCNVFCLQEVDMKIVRSTLHAAGFDGISTPTTNAGAGRVDACCIFWDREIWSLVEKEVVQFDDLASLGTTKLDDGMGGLRQSFLRRNVAILARLRHLKTHQQVVVANAHLFWNPSYDFVKLCQAHLLTQRARAFAATTGDPIVMCGDLNSKPHNSVHTYLTTGIVNAQSYAPWYNNNPGDEGESSGGAAQITTSSSNKDDETDEFLLSGLQKLKLSEKKAPEIRYLLDYTLNRFCRWLRILGIDAALETQEEEIERTKNSNILIFERCREEGRTLVTTSYKLMQRKDCPSTGAYLINAKTIPNLELSLVHLLSTHGVTLRPETFLARCVVCNGNICTVDDEEKKKSIFRTYQAPELATQGLECYECDSCGQGYWWDDRPTSSASRVKTQATHLFELCLRGGVQMEGPLHMFDMVDVDAQRQRGLDENMERESMEVVKWLKDKQLRCPIALQSAYALKDEKGNIVGESKPFSNVTADFVGLLDYVLFESERFELIGNLYVPTSFNDLSGKNSRLRNGYVLPSDIWPSDHLAVGAELVLRNPTTTRAGHTAVSPTATTEAPPVPSSVGQEVDQDGEPSHYEDMFCGVIGIDGSAPPPPPLAIGAVSAAAPPIMSNNLSATTIDPPTSHAPRCGCGCVPNSRSLFEMAELRKQHKLRKEARLATKQGRSA